MQQYPDGPVYAWIPTGRVEDTTSIVGVTPMAVKRVYIRIFPDYVTYLDVPVDQYNPETIQRMGNLVAQNHFSIQSLHGPEIPREAL